jgi:hypothetical protein
MRAGAYLRTCRRAFVGECLRLASLERRSGKLLQNPHLWGRGREPVGFPQPAATDYWDDLQIRKVISGIVHKQDRSASWKDGGGLESTSKKLRFAEDLWMIDGRIQGRQPY